MAATHDSDASTRYILPADAPYLKNLAALWALDPELAEAIEALPDDAAYLTEPSKAGPLTVAFASSNGRKVYLHSRYQPIDEAQKLIAQVDLEKVVFYLQGFGLGYHAELLFEKASDEALFFFFEPDLRLLRTAFENRDLSAILESKRCHIFWKLDKAELYGKLTPQTAIISLGTQSVMHAPSIQLQPDFHNQMEIWLAEFASFCRTNMNTLVLNGRRTAENISRNLGWYVGTPCVSKIANEYKGKPAIIVSAGPSLRKNKHLLQSLVGKAVIIAVQTTLQPLIDMGITPDFVTALDYHDICTRFFEKLPKNIKTHLVAEPKATNAIFALHTGPLTLIGNDLAENLLREVAPKKAGLRSGSTVAHLAYYVAEHIGCEPIIFVGQDLGFSDGLYYSPGTSYEDVWRPELSRFCTVEMKQWEQIVRDRPILRQIPDIHGRPMYTEERLFSYLQHFEKDFLSTKTTIIDASEGGAAKRGTVVMPLAEAIEKYCQAPLAGVEKTPQGVQWDRAEACVISLEKRKQEACEIESVSRSTLPLLEDIRDHVEDQPRVNAAIAKIDVLRSRMNDLGRTYDMVTQLTQTSELKRFEADRKIKAAKVDGRELQRRQVQRDIDNVRGVMEAAREFQGLMDEVIGRLKSGHEYHE